jgi:hypothetical protein
MAFADNVEIFDSYYNGGLTIDMKVPSPNKVSGLMTLSVDANDFSVKNATFMMRKHLLVVLS